jgi:hypothetical protein
MSDLIKEAGMAWGMEKAAIDWDTALDAHGARQYDKMYQSARLIEKAKKKGVHPDKIWKEMPAEYAHAQKAWGKAKKSTAILDRWEAKKDAGKIKSVKK